VFQRTPNYATPIGNYPTDPEEEAADKANYAAIRELSRTHRGGVPYFDVQPSALAVTPEERRQVFDDRWNRGGFRLFADSFADIMIDREANETVAQYIRDRIRERVDDPATAELLTPRGYPYGTKRPPLETDYYEAYNRRNVDLVDVASNAIDAVTPTGVRLADGTEFVLDVLILATGFDASTGPLLAMNITGRDGLRLADHWAEGPQTYLGLMASGFPNLFMITGPQSPSVLYNMPLAIEDHVDFAVTAITHLESSGKAVIEPTRDAEQEWVAHTDEVADATLMTEAPTSWYLGTNVVGKPRRIIVYLGGGIVYRAKCQDVVEKGYEGFMISGEPTARTRDGVAVALDPDVQALLDGLAAQGAQSFEKIGVDATRAAVDSIVGLQLPSREVADVVEASYGPHPEQRLRIHVPPGDGPFPVVLYLHGGGFVAGGLDVVAERASALALDAGAVVVTAGYRRAPEARFPAAHDDAFAALLWTARKIGTHGGAADRITVLGDSAGAMLAAAATIRARDEGAPAVRSLALLYPLVDVGAETVSRAEFAEGYLLHRAALDWFREQYLATADEASDPRLALLRNKLSGLPPTLVVTVECDPLRDEGEMFAAALRAAGTPVRQERIEGLVHAMYWASAAVKRSSELHDAVLEHLQTLP
jgi:acetyl esterase/lipase